MLHKISITILRPQSRFQEHKVHGYGASYHLAAAQAIVLLSTLAIKTDCYMPAVYELLGLVFASDEVDGELRVDHDTVRVEWMSRCAPSNRAAVPMSSDP